MSMSCSLCSAHQVLACLLIIHLVKHVCMYVQDVAETQEKQGLKEECIEFYDKVCFHDPCHSAFWNVTRCHVTQHMGPGAL